MRWIIRKRIDGGDGFGPSTYMLGMLWTQMRWFKHYNDTIQGMPR